jgi:hypothetical protein
MFGTGSIYVPIFTPRFRGVKTPDRLRTGIWLFAGMALSPGSERQDHGGTSCGRTAA